MNLQFHLNPMTCINVGLTGNPIFLQFPSPGETCKAIPKSADRFPRNPQFPQLKLGISFDHRLGRLGFLMMIERERESTFGGWERERSDETKTVEKKPFFFLLKSRGETEFKTVEKFLTAEKGKERKKREKLFTLEMIFPRNCSAPNEEAYKAEGGRFLYKW